MSKEREAALVHIELDNVLVDCTNIIQKGKDNANPDIFDHEDICEARSLAIQYTFNVSTEVMSKIASATDVNWDNFVQSLSDDNFKELQHAIKDATK